MKSKTLIEIERDRMKWNDQKIREAIAFAEGKQPKQEVPKQGVWAFIKRAFK